VAAHLWLAEIEWIEAGMRSDHELLSEAARRVPSSVDLPSLLERFQGWIRHPRIRSLLSRDAYPAGTGVARELSFIVREGDRVVEGRADRVLYVPEAAGSRLIVVDWKTDLVDPEDTTGLERVIERYRPQMEAYAQSLAKTEDCPLDRVETVLAFVSAGIVRRI
jgi:ATP-dependent exoDNAse (exonuclease V) beta subunit